MRRWTVLGGLIAACTAPSCARSPSAPTPIPIPGVQISNLRVETLGLRSAACGVGRTGYTSIDEVTFDFTATEATLAGALVSRRLDSGSYTNLGHALTACALDDPCSAPNALPNQFCVVSGSPSTRGTIRGYEYVAWEPTTTWRVNILSELGRSNELSATLQRSEALPYGDVAAIVGVSAMRCANTYPSPSAACYVNPAYYGDEAYSLFLDIYHPRRAGRTVLQRLAAYTPDGHLLQQIENSFEEASISGVGYGLIADFLTSFKHFPSPPYRIVGSITESENGIVIHEESKEIVYP